MLPIGLLGVGATFALFTLELRGIQKCRALIKAGKEFEEGPSKKDLGYHFARSPQALRFRDFFRRERRRTAAEERPADAFEGAVSIDAALAARVMYPSVLSAWIFVALVGLSKITSAVFDFPDVSSGNGATLAKVVFLAVIVALLFFLILYQRTGQLLEDVDKDPD